MIPGFDILGLALMAIQRQEFLYRPFISRSLNGIGDQIPVYGPLVDVSGSVQPVPRTMYQFMGLDFQKFYMNFFIERAVIDIARDVSGDQFIFQGKTFQCLSRTAWHNIDGWDQVLCVEVPYANYEPGLNWGFDQYHQNYDNGNFTDS